jgi:putative two-component system response regulator
VSVASQRILVVDDEEPIRNLLRRLLERQGYRCEMAADPAEARELLARNGGFELVLSDVNMPGESGLELARDVLGRYDDVAVVLVSGTDEPQYVDAALEHGAYGYVLKPFKPNELVINVANALRRRELEIAARLHRTQLEQTVEERTAELRETITSLQTSERELRRLQEVLIHRLSWVAEFRNQETGEHIVRMSLYCQLLAQLAGFDAGRADMLRTAAPMHDVGKIVIPDAVLLKPGPLTEEERRLMETHTVMGHRIFAGSGVELLELAATLALTHHERADGLGYPGGLRGDEIPVEGRIAAIADVFDALTSDRVYRPAFSLEDARALLVEGRGTQFDAHLLDLFLGAWNEVLEIRRGARSLTN